MRTRFPEPCGESVELLTPMQAFWGVCFHQALVTVQWNPSLTFDFDWQLQILKACVKDTPPVSIHIFGKSDKAPKVIIETKGRVKAFVRCSSSHAVFIHTPMIRHRIDCV